MKSAVCGKSGQDKGHVHEIRQFGNVHKGVSEETRTARYFSAAQNSSLVAIAGDVTI